MRLTLTRFASLLLASVMVLVLFPFSAQAQPTSQNAKVKVKVLKPLVITKNQDLDFGTIAVPGLASSVTVTINQAGTLDCPAPLICSGTALPASYNVKGSNRAPVDISVSAGDLTNAADGSTIPFTVDAPTMITLPNSGNKGTDFTIGGAIEIPNGASGDYEATIEVIAEYQ